MRMEFRAVLIMGTLLLASGFILGSPVFAEDSKLQEAMDDHMAEEDYIAYLKNIGSGWVDPCSFTPPDDDDGTVIVPEPGTIALLGLGLASLGVARRRQQQKKKQAGE